MSPGSGIVGSRHSSCTRTVRPAAAARSPIAPGPSKSTWVKTSKVRSGSVTAAR